eukprot:TRINITY_DN76467_c0_g1_i1.p1 TRINITY_DN76467_c0_g1~~TRINITY_DN76467_c0_g1_i1.p1  ORF type:complete len:382 (+),score=53.57 TRINITY_DN76467_c0_g1_i1:69-1214(+)
MKWFWLALTSCFVSDGTARERLVHLHGDGFARGAALAKARGSSIRKLFELKLSVYGKIDGAVEKWSAMAKAAEEQIREHAPVSWQELQGAANAGMQGVNMHTMLMLAVEYEVYVELTSSVRSHPLSPADKCTGFGAPGLSGQNNDEVPSLYLDGAEDVVLSLLAPDGTGTLIYTHPGWPAYMGMNSHGLSVLWQYIDTGERGPGVPTNVLIREMLAQTSLQSALRFLKHTPRMIPNNFILTDLSGVVNVEVSSTHFTPLALVKGFVVHTNHLLFDQGMQDRDIGNSKTSKQRYEAMRAMVRQHDGSPINIEHLQTMLATHPVFRDGANGTDNDTLASLVFDSHSLSMGIWFKGDTHGSAQRFSIPSKPTTQPDRLTQLLVA